MVSMACGIRHIPAAHELLPSRPNVGESVRGIVGHDQAACPREDYGMHQVAADARFLVPAVHEEAIARRATAEPPTHSFKHKRHHARRVTFVRMQPTRMESLESRDSGRRPLLYEQIEIMQGRVVRRGENGRRVASVETYLANGVHPLTTTRMRHLGERHHLAWVLKGVAHEASTQKIGAIGGFTESCESLLKRRGGRVHGGERERRATDRPRARARARTFACAGRRATFFRRKMPTTSTADSPTPPQSSEAAEPPVPQESSEAADPPAHAKINRRVAITGLKGRPELNGQNGRVVSWDAAKGRCGVRLSSGESVSLKPVNLEPAASEPKMNFGAMFAGTLSLEAPDITWNGDALPRVFMDFVEGDYLGRPTDQSLGRVVFELWPQHAPKSAENFRALCTGERGVSKWTKRRLHYKETSVHQAYADQAVLAGDTSRRDPPGRGGESIWKEDFEDRSGTHDGAPKHDRPGVLSMGNPYDKPPNDDPEDQDPNKRWWPSFGSRFAVYLVPDPKLDGRHPVFGRVVEGLEVLVAISRRPVDVKPRRNVPITPVVIADCGELPREQWRPPSDLPPPVPAPATTAGVDDGPRIEELDTTPPAPPTPSLT